MAYNADCINHGQPKGPFRTLDDTDSLPLSYIQSLLFYYPNVSYHTTKLMYHQYGSDIPGTPSHIALHILQLEAHGSHSRFPHARQTQNEARQADADPCQELASEIK